MERRELIEELKKKANISYEEAEEALEKSNWDLLEAIIYLENQGKAKASEETVIIKMLDKNNNYNKKSDYKKEQEQESSETSDVFGRLFNFLGKMIKKGNVNYLEIRRKEEKPIKISLTISVILTIFVFWLVAILLVTGLFFGFKYSIVGPNINNDKVNDILTKASDTAEDIKRDFQDGYKNC